MKMFEVQHINKAFKLEDERQPTLQDVSLEAKTGEFLCLMGPSGCGKSTLLRIMAGLEKTDSGYILNRPDRIGFVFQNFGLMPWLTVEQNIAFGLKTRGIGGSQLTDKVAEQIRMLGLSGLGQSHPKELSGGQKQRVGIARALAVDPEVLMLDEPFSALDAFTADELRKDVLRIWKETGKTIIMVTHLPEEAAELASRIVVFSPRPGSVVKEINNRMARPRNQRSPEFFRLVDQLESLIRQ